MNWVVEVKPNAEKQYGKLDRETRQRTRRALAELEESDQPFLHPKVRALTGTLSGDYRLRIGKWRVLFTPNSTDRLISVYAIVPRGDAY